MEGKCTIYFEDPFWVGVFERIEDDTIAVARQIFGDEPTDTELYRFVLEEYSYLEFGAPCPLSTSPLKSANFKRAQRAARQMMKRTGVSTMAQRAMQAGYERLKTERQADQRAQRAEQAEQKFIQKQKRKKQKHRGR